MRSSKAGMTATRTRAMPKNSSDEPSKQKRSLQRSSPKSPAKITDDCDACMQKELCTVYNGSNCLLLQEHGVTERT